MLMVVVVVLGRAQAQQKREAPPSPPPSPGRRWVVLHNTRVEGAVHGAVGAFGAAIVRAFNTTRGGVTTFEWPNGKVPQPFAVDDLQKRPGGFNAAS